MHETNCLVLTYLRKSVFTTEAGPKLQLASAGCHLIQYLSIVEMVCNLLASFRWFFLLTRTEHHNKFLVFIIINYTRHLTIYLRIITQLMQAKKIDLLVERQHILPTRKNQVLEDVQDGRTWVAHVVLC